MSTALFISNQSQYPNNWREAFNDAEMVTGLPEKFDIFSTTPIFLDFTGLDAEERVSWLRCAVSTTRRVIVLTPVPKESEALQVMKAGAVGYGHSFSVPKRLQNMLNVANEGGLWLGSSLVKKVLLAVSGRKTPELKQPQAMGDYRAIMRRYAELTDREAQVARFVAKGATNQEISKVLGIKDRTVKAHITNCFKKLNVRNRVELALLLHNIPVSSEGDGDSSKQHAL